MPLINPRPCAYACAYVDSVFTSHIKVARYSFSGSIPPKFEHKLRRHKQRYGKIATTVVLEKDKNLLWSGLQGDQSCHSNEMTLLAKLWRAKRACGAPWLSKSTLPKEFGNHVTVHRPSTPQGNQCSIPHFLASLGAPED